jgi:hypothetical protein
MAGDIRLHLAEDGADDARLAELTRYLRSELAAALASLLTAAVLLLARYRPETPASR